MSKALDRNDLIEKMNLGEISPDMQDQIIAQLGENVLKSVLIEVKAELEEGELEEFDSLIKKDNPETIEKFLLEKIPSFDSLVKEKMSIQMEAVRRAMSV